MRTQQDEQLLPVLEMMVCFTALRLDILQLSVCLRLLLWIDGFTLLVFIPGAKSDCDLIYVVHSGQWPVSRPEAALCHLFHCVISGLQWMGSVWNLWTENGPLRSLCYEALREFNRVARNEQSDHVLCFRKVDHLQHRHETRQKPAVTGKPSVSHHWALESSLGFPWPGYVFGIWSACFLHSANLLLGTLSKWMWIRQRLVTGASHGEAVSEVPGELLFSFPSRSKSAESLSELCLLISLASTKLSPLFAPPPHSEYTICCCFIN